MTLDVTQGSVIAVDPDELRAIAGRIDQAVDAAERGASHVARSTELQTSVPSEVPILIVRPDMTRLVGGWWRDEAAGLAASLRMAADAYQALELRTLLAMHGAHAETSAGASARQLLHDLVERNPTAGEQANHLWEAWRATAGDGLVDTWQGAGPAGAGAMAMLLLGMRAIRGRIGMGPGSLGEPRRATLREGRVPGTSDRFVPMTATQILGSASNAPTGLAESIARIPNGETPEWGDNARVRVDRYAMPGGEERFSVYIGGSREAPWHEGDPFAWGNNAGLYAGRAGSEGYDFVLEALERAGAQPGSAVDATGFSQGAMVAQRLATDSDFEVQHVTTIGAPLRIPMGEEVTSITLAHDDDPVAALSDGGSPMRLGDDDSLLIRRPYDPAGTGPFEWDVEAHRVGAYAETARVFEESGDMRGESVRAHFDRLAEAVSVESFVFHAPEEPVPRAVGGAGEKDG